MKGSKTFTRAAGKCGCGVNCSDPSFTWEMKSLPGQLLSSPVLFLTTRFILRVMEEQVKKHSQRSCVFGNSLEELTPTEECSLSLCPLALGYFSLIHQRLSMILQDPQDGLCLAYK